MVWWRPKGVLSAQNEVVEEVDRDFEGRSMQLILHFKQAYNMGHVTLPKSFSDDSWEWYNRTTEEIWFYVLIIW